MNVCGLLPGSDVERALAGAGDIEIALVPDVMLDDEERFIDGTTLAQVSERTGVRMRPVRTSGEALIEALVGAGGEGGKR